VGLPERDLVSFVGAIVFSTFLHAGLLHIAGNMLFLWIFGNNVEDHLGRVKYLAFYLLGGIAAGFAQVLAHLGPCSQADPAPCTPAVGASGAVAAVMGAYFVLFPRARVNVLVPIIFIFTVVAMSAWVVLGLWFVFQLVLNQPGVAWEAHVGGFVFGVAAILLLGGRPHRPAPAAWRQGWRSGWP
jgi:membrane associated rhomboid family serine protease